MNPYILPIKNSNDLIQEFKKIGVDKGGIEIMRHKGVCRVVKIHDIASFVANILKQEMLSLGGDVALSRWSLTGRDKKTDCLVLGSIAQLTRLGEKLRKQPFNLGKIGGEILLAVNNFDKSERYWDVRGKNIFHGKHTLVMGVINATPDSFSGDGILNMSPSQVLSHARKMVMDGADILDIGGESSRPGAKSVSLKEELKRVLFVLKPLEGKISVPISIDTVKSEVAHAALDKGAAIVNDISSLGPDKKMGKLISRYKASVILMHKKGSSKSMQINPHYDDIMSEVILFLRKAVSFALDCGIPEEKIIVDPGIGFGKNLDHNLEILEKLSSLKSLGRPILIGLSRKWFIGKILKAQVNNRIWGTAAATSLAIANGADIVRLHDVKELKQVVLMADALMRRNEGI